MVFGILIFIILALCSFVYNTVADEHRFASAVCLLIFTYLFSSLIILNEIDKEPSALEVYQGKTTLEITYKDGVPIDSVVVYKDK